jgi:hypothetical protein
MRRNEATPNSLLLRSQRDDDRFVARQSLLNIQLVPALS